MRKYYFSDSNACGKKHGLLFKRPAKLVHVLNCLGLCQEIEAHLNGKNNNNNNNRRAKCEFIYIFERQN